MLNIKPLKLKIYDKLLRGTHIVTKGPSILQLQGSHGGLFAYPGGWMTIDDLADCRLVVPSQYAEPNPLSPNYLLRVNFRLGTFGWFYNEWVYVGFNGVISPDFHEILPAKTVPLHHILGCSSGDFRVKCKLSIPILINKV